MAENYFIDQTRLNGRVAVVTGAGRGLGKEIALALASAGSDICLMARTESQLEETAREIEACGRKALVIPIDVAKSEEVDHAIERVTQNLGPVDILVNNAGITEQKPLVKITDEDWRNRERWNEYELSVSDMVLRTSTEIAPWTLVAGNDKRYARIEILKTFCDRLEAALDQHRSG